VSRRAQVWLAAIVSLMVLAVAAVAQIDRVAFDRAAFEARTKSSPVYQHSPVTIRFGQDVAVNLHAIVAWRPNDQGITVIEPGGIVIPVPWDEFDAIVARYTRRVVDRRE